MAKRRSSPPRRPMVLHRCEPAAPPKPGPRAKPEPIRFLSVDECIALFRVARKESKRDHALLLVSYRHGLRASEVGLLKRDGLDLKTNRIRFHLGAEMSL